MSGTLNRRDFLFYTGAAVAGVTLGEVGRRQLARADERASGWRDRGVERWVPSVCRECPAACGVRVRLVDNVPVKLEGNPNCPIARGRLCAKGQAALESYFDPDRLTGPARRIGQRGEKHWESITWDEAVRLVASRWPRRPMAGETEPIALGGPERGPLADAWMAMWRAAGAHVAWTAAATAAMLRPALAALTGVDADPLFDLEHATYVLSFGAPLVEDWISPLWAQRSYGRFRRGATHARGRLVHVDGRRSLTARKADEWIALPPEQQITLAYGIASVVLREHRADAAFIEQFGGTLPAFEAQLVAQFSPDDVAALTGVPVVTVLRLARELAASPRPLVIVAADADRRLVDAALALNALLGAFDRPGGIVASPVRPLNDLEDATLLLREVATGKRRPAALVFRDASPLRALTTPIISTMDTDAIPLIVSFSPYLDEAAATADLLLPTHTSLESWHLATPASAISAEVLAAAPPAVLARLNTQDLMGVLKRIVEVMGGSAASAAAWTSSGDIVTETLNRVGAFHRGGPCSSTYETEWLRQLEQGGWWVPTGANADETIAAVLQAGGWVDPAPQPAGIRETLRARGGLTFAPPAAFPAPSPSTPVSAATDAPGDQSPLHLVAFTPGVVNLAGNPNHPALFELLGQPDGAPWSAWAELHPDAARVRRIRNGDRVRITSPSGSITARAQLVDGMPRANVAVSFVPHVTGAGRWAALVAEDVRRLQGPNGFEGARTVTVERV